LFFSRSICFLRRSGGFFLNGGYVLYCGQCFRLESVHIICVVYYSFELSG
jgi:uncharacterized membrane protein